MSAGSSKLDGSAGCSNTQADPNPSSITPREADMKSSEAIFPEIAVETEIAAMAVLVDAFGTLDAAARHRVLKWANERWGVVPQ